MHGRAPSYTGWLYAGLAVLTLIPFVADLVFPLGTAVWVIYLLPTVLAFLAPRPQVPPVVAAISTLLTILGFTLAPAGIDPSVALFNRALALSVIWLLAITGFLFVRNRLAIQREEWLQAGQVGHAHVQPDALQFEEGGVGALSA